MKSAEGTGAFQNSTDIKHVQDIRLNNMERLGRDCVNSKGAVTNSETNIELIQEELASFGPITIDEWILYGKELVWITQRKDSLMRKLKTQEEEDLQSIKD